MSMGGGSSSIEETEEQKVSAEIGRSRYDYYQDSFAPVENEYIETVQALNDEKNHKAVAGDVATEFKGQFADVAEQNIEAMAADGIDPSSGKATDMQESLAGTHGAAQADATNRAQVDLQNSYTRGLQNVVAMGEGQATEAQQGLQDIANNSADVAAEKARMNTYESNQNKGVVAMGAGVLAESATGG